MSFFEYALSENFVSCIREYLDDNPEGVKEYDLLCQMDDRGLFQKLDTTVSAPLLLFQKHFLLFHLLYSINQQLVEDKIGALQISPLMIKKLNYAEAGTQMGSVDALSEYYLDLNNLETANENNVNDMLDSFWEKFLRNDKRGDALKVLGLSDPVSDKEITLRYRKLANTHHPDKGGDHGKIQEINEAYAVLIKV
ncbi:DNA-J related domain-containing protein [Kaarinaea lacus]